MEKRIQFEGIEIPKPMIMKLEPDFTIGDYLDNVCDYLQRNSSEYALEMNGLQLDEELRIADAGIEDGNILQLIRKGDDSSAKPPDNVLMIGKAWIQNNIISEEENISLKENFYDQSKRVWVLVYDGNNNQRYTVEIDSDMKVRSYIPPN